MSIAGPMTTTQVYRIYIRATPQAIWDAITLPEWTRRYGYTGLIDYDLRPGGAWRVTASPPGDTLAEALGTPSSEVIMEGVVLTSDPPKRLVTTFRMLAYPDIASEPITQVTQEIKQWQNGICSLTFTHELAGAPNLAEIVRGGLEDGGAGGGHAWVLSDLKTLLETGRGFAE